jgi:hypothetical protein
VFRWILFFSDTHVAVGLVVELVADIACVALLPRIAAAEAEVDLV